MTGPAAMPPLIVIGGATATGKTELAIVLGETIARGGRPVAVISADSRQVFRGLDIGTAKVPAADRARIPHFGLDLVEPDQPFSVADFVAHAEAVLRDLGRVDGVALLAGGTGLSLRAVARGLDAAALPSDPEIRARLEAELHVDLPPPRGYAGPVAWLGLTVAPDVHVRWIATRAQSQFDAGLIEEARALRERFDPALPAFSAIGYREAWAVLDGELSLDAAVDLDARRNVAFAKRQRTWFRAETGISWLDATERLPATAALEVSRAVVEACRS
ncbi:MAG: hypothetical protein HY262_12805 [Chloroflexi bacterium]|nr:hypothetical protein [Chloroflexota bacterium]